MRMTDSFEFTLNNPLTADSQQYFRKHYPCFTCSECGYRKDSQKKWNYCPNCGARMDEDEK